MDKTIRYVDGEKIRILFIYQVASFWPTWESFYYSCLNDDRFDTVLLLLREHGSEKFQMRTAEAFLIERKIKYIDFDEFDIKSFRPHYAVYQTPYFGHRLGNIDSWSSNLYRMGIRIVYIPYGIEIADTESADLAHFKMKLHYNCFRIYTFSEDMKKLYEERCHNSNAVRVFGLPKFDGLFFRNRFPLEKKLVERINNRKVVLWKVHFPKSIIEDGEERRVSPDFCEYVRVAEMIKQYKDLFFIFMPHPKIWDCDETERKKVEQIFKALDSSENAYIDKSDDYRFSLMNAEAIITDRSAIMVEASTVGCPVMYVYNDGYDEPLTPPIKKLVNSYYKGTDADSIVGFIEMIRRGEDPLFEFRKRTFNEVIPYFDGKCGERIKEDLYESLVIKDDYSTKSMDYAGAKVLIWGTGYVSSKLYYFLYLGEKKGLFKVEAYVDNNEEKWGIRFQNKTIIGPRDIRNYSYDYIVLALDGKASELRDQLFELGVDESKIIDYDKFIVGISYE